MKISDEQFAKLHLFRCKGVGPVMYKKLVSEYGNASNALANLHRHNKLGLLDKSIVNIEIEKTKKAGANFVFEDDTNFPSLLKHINDCPPVLIVLGDPVHLNTRQFSIVGNRNASAASMRLCEDISGELGLNGLTITSGMARGIDTAAHCGALAANCPTIAVLAGGIDFIYPPENKNLYNEIAANGCVVTEMAIEMAPTAQHFPRRNRIISGMSLGTLVVEAPKKSGSLITARYALEQGREVFAVPGSPSDSRSSGPNYLLKQGAIMVENAMDIIPNIPQYIEPPAPKPQTLDMFAQQPKHTEPIEKHEELTEITTDIKSLLSSSPTEMDDIVRRSGLPETEVIIKITEMDIMGEIERTSTGAVVLK